MWITKISKFIKFLLIFPIITAWLFSGFPPIWQNPPAPLDKYLSGPFPPKIQEAWAATTTVFLTTGTTWTVPSDWNNNANAIEVIGGGAGGGGGATGSGNASGSGGAGGAYAEISNLTLTAGGSVTIQVGAAGTGGAAGALGTSGTATWFNGATCAGASACGDLGNAALSNSVSSVGGSVTNSVGTTKFAGGNGGAGSGSLGTSGGGGGGAAGLNGAGTNATAGPSAGGSGDAGFGGAGGAAGNPAANGSAGTEYDATHGSGGGGGGGNVKATTATGGTGGLYGAGGGGGAGKAAGGNGAQGLIVIRYTPAASLTFVVSTNNFSTLTPGSPVFATSTLSVNTTNSTGWNVTLSRNTAAATMAFNTDSTVQLTDQADWIPGAATTTAGNAVRISSFLNAQKALAFRVMTASGTASFISTTWWGTTDNYLDSATTLWAGIASSTAANLKIGNSSVSSGGSAVLNTVLYYLDVPSTQQSGAYSGGITYTATMNP